MNRNGETVFFISCCVDFLFLSRASAQGTAMKNRAEPTTKPLLHHIMLNKSRGPLKFSKNLPSQTLNFRVASSTNYFANAGIALKTPVWRNNYSIQKLSFFCQKEWQFEKLTSIPLRIRLGSLEYTNYLEKKPNSLRHL